MSIADLIRTLTINVGGPAAVSQTFLPYVERSKRKVIMNMTSGLGSIALEHGKKNASYSISKTAINMLVRILWFFSRQCGWNRDGSLTLVRVMPSAMWSDTLADV